MPYESRNIDELLRGYRNADAAAFDAFFRQTRTLVFNYLVARLGNRQEAEDAFQETYLRVHRYVASYDETKGAVSWLLAVARNVMLDTVAKRRLGRVELTDELPAPSARTAEALEARTALVAILADLSDDDRKLIESRLVNDATYEELAAEQGLSPANARQRVSRLLRRLRQPQPRRS